MSGPSPPPVNKPLIITLLFAITGQEYNLFSIVIFGTLIMCSKGNGALKLGHPEKESGSLNLRQRECYSKILKRPCRKKRQTSKDKGLLDCRGGK